MMEIARSGVFNPEMFTFNEIIIIFFAVMITDVLLLDAFNSMGLPTSTTVSIVFELLGGAVAAALIKISTSDILLSQLGDFINSQKALAIVSGILISVVVAFVAGVVVQYITRLIFTFHYERMYRRIGGIFGGLSLTAIFYFLIMKGAKGASFMKPEYLAWINAHTLPILLVLFAGLSVVLHLLMVRRGVNIFKIVILAGTFALAFAFAGNDLVNFVGVPLAAWESWQQFTASGMAPDAFTMEGLRKAVQTPTFYLLLSGLIMVLTLWFSKNGPSRGADLHQPEQQHPRRSGTVRLLPARPPHRARRSERQQDPAPDPAPIALQRSRKPHAARGTGQRRPLCCPSTRCVPPSTWWSPVSSSPRPPPSSCPCPPPM